MFFFNAGSKTIKNQKLYIYFLGSNNKNNISKKILIIFNIYLIIAKMK